ncbi:LCP family protein [Streptococcus sp. DD13]|uniref:LCP family protein n=1 Tax=Streptococcus sp. DD13 TaxID=1777881 RepID=UPI00079797E0|nr:LCP family protein [Streptococcus sp. DD13]KXT79079.1 Cell envelope-associated transcriptional attenuator LytR-CpsA-Psr, subfamily F1 [Streptococcus sp. DD13]
MTNEQNRLSHHEELRLDYLRKRVHYLTPKEQKELDYLEYKVSQPAHTERETHQDPRSQSASRRSVAPSRSVQSREAVEDDGLPFYPREAQTRKNRKRQSSSSSARQKNSRALPIDEQIRTSHRPIAPGKGGGRPPKRVKKIKKKRRWVKRILISFLLLLLATIAGMTFMFLRGLNMAKTDAQAKAAKTEYFNGQNTRDGVNLLIVGTDGRVGQTSAETRTDSIMVVNINNKDGKIKMVSFMRDILVNMGGIESKLNAAYSAGALEAEENPSNTKMSGAENLRQVLKENFDIDVKHYALVDFSTFATAIDTLFPEGVEIDAQFATVDGRTVTEVDVPDDLGAKNGVVPTQTIRVGKQKMNGRTLLNYARFRHDDENDFGRTKRQQQVLSAIMTQVKNPTKLFTGAEAIGKVYALTSTSIPFDFLLTNGAGTLLSAGGGIESLTIPSEGDYQEGFDAYGGVGLEIDFAKYRDKLSQLGLR